MQNSGLSKAMALHQQGRFGDAIPLYQAFLRANRKHAGAANLLGVALMQAGRLEEAAAAIRNALRLHPGQASTHYNLGTVLQALSRNEDAADHFRKAIALQPGDAQSHNNLGVVLKALGRNEEAAEAYRAATVLKPDFAQAHANLAAALSTLERHDEAIQSGERALALNPKLAEVHVCIGNALFDQGKTLEALQAFDRAIALQPDRPKAYFCAGNAMMSIDFEDRAVEHFRRVVLLDPKSASARFRLATCLYTLKLYGEASEEAKKAFEAMSERSDKIEDEVSAGTYLLKANKNEQALAHFKRALALDPNSLGALDGCANALSLLQHSGEAIELFDRILERRSRVNSMNYNKAFPALSSGDFRQGWKFFEYRFSGGSGSIPLREYSAPKWDGRTISGPLLIWGEQGLGDQIMHASIVRDAGKRADKIVLDVEPRLIPLLARSFPELQIRPLHQELLNDAGIAAHVPIGGLGEFFRLDWKDFPQQAYLVADRERAGKLRGVLHEEQKCAIGISWRSANAKTGIHKTAGLSDFASLLAQPGIDFVDLQYGETAAELRAVREKLGIVVRHIGEIDNTKDIDGLAALIEACDAVVTVSNTTAHIAGALGKPVWILIPHGQGRQWYWFKDRRDSPWYPGARIVRQRPNQSWAELIASMAPEISEFAQAIKAKS